MTEPGFAAALREVVLALEATDIPYMVVGSFASGAHGEPRTTRDLDLLIDPTPDQLEQLLTRLPSERYYVDADAARDARKRRSMFNVIHIPSAWKLDMIVRKPGAFYAEELRRRQKQVLGGVPVDMATAEDTVIAKLQWSHASGTSEVQLRDIVGILRLRATELDVAYIERWVDELELRDQWARAQSLATS